MKKVFSLLLCFLLILALAVPALAASPRIVDRADLLTDDQVQELEKTAEAISEKYKIELVIVTVNNTGFKSVEAYADDYFDDNGYGYGSERSGILFLLSMDEREWAISTAGDGIYALTDYGVESVFESIAGDLSQNRYYDAFDAYLDALVPYLDAFQRGEPIDGYVHDYDGPGSYEHASGDDVVHYPVEEKLTTGKVIFRLAIALGIGCIAGGITVSAMKSGMNTAVSQHDAGPYLRSGSFKLTRQQDMFLYSRTSRVARDTDSGTRSGGGYSGGGSHVHTSSGGISHGGGHGRF